MPLDMQAGTVKDSRKLELSSMTNCWICEGWSEHRFTYKPGVSDDTTGEHDPFVPINLHLDIDHFEADLMVPEENDPQMYYVYRMLPPGDRKYFYTVGGTIQVANDQA